MYSDSELAAAFAPWSVSIPPIGDGGFKVVYKLDRGQGPEALKIIKETIAPTTTDGADAEIQDLLPERLSRELHALASIDCPHLARVTGQAEVRKIGSAHYVWFIEQLYSGGTLEKLLAAGPIGFIRTVEVCLGVARAIDALWSQQAIVHRDIKPGNIAFDHRGTPILLDLGIAYFAEMSSITGTGEISPSTRPYSAPEQFEVRRNIDIDFRTDLYLLGIVAYQCAIGRHPFLTSSRMTLDQYFHNMETFHLENSNLPVSFTSLVNRLLSYQMNRRPRRIRDVISSLEGLL